MARRWTLPLLLLITLAAFCSVAANDFVNYDDDGFVTANPQVRAGLTLQGLRWACTTTELAVWQPLAWITLMIQAQLFGLRPAGFHLVSLAIHLANTALLLGFLTRATGSRWRSVGAVAIFAIHPLRVESVAWVAEQRDLFSVFFALLALHAYVRWARSNRIGWFAVVVLCWLLSLMTKPMMVTLPAILLLLDFWPLHRWTGSPDNPIPAADQLPVPRVSFIRLLVEKLPFLLGGLVLSIGTMISHSSHGITPIWKSPDAGARLAEIAISYVRYLGKIVWFKDLSVFYPRQPAWPAWQIAGAVLTLAAISFLSLWRARRNPWLIIGWLWYVVTLLPVIGIVQFGAHSIADRYTYFSGIGLLIMLFWSLPEWNEIRRPARAALAAAGAAALAVMLVCTIIQVGYWRNSESLFEHALKVAPDNYIAHNNLASALLGRGDNNRAMQHFRRAIELRPAYSDAHAGLGLILEQQGRNDQAIREYQAALQGAWPNNLARTQLGFLLLRRGQAQESLKHFEDALASNPRNGNAIYGAGLALNELGRVREAVQHLRRVVQIDPNHSRAHFNLGAVLLRIDDKPAAAAEFARAVQLEPGYARGHCMLGLTLMEMGKTAEAIPHLQRAEQLDPNLTPARIGLNQIHSQRQRPQPSRPSPR